MAADWPELDSQQAEWERQFVAVEPKDVGASGLEPVTSASTTNAEEYLAISDWHWVGPFSDIERYLKSKEHGPEGKTSIDLTEKFKLPTGKEIGWVRKPEWVDGKVHNDLPGDPAANFLYRTIIVGKPQDLEISLGSDDGIRVYLNNELLLKRDNSQSAKADQEKLTLKLKRGENHLLLKILNFSGPSGFYFAAKTDRLIMSPDVFTAVTRPADERSVDESKLVRQFFRNAVAQLAALDQLRAALAANRKERTEVDTAVATTLIFKETATPKPSYILNRGEYDQHGAEVTRRTPTVLPPMDPSAPNNRLGLAKWVVSPANPLPARVAVNRFWQQFFGIGLVKTTNDFGTRANRQAIRNSSIGSPSISWRAAGT